VKAPIVLVLACLAAAASQDPEPPPAPVEPPPLPVFDPGGGQDPRQEMIELFHKVEQRLGEIDDRLYEASAGSPIGEQQDAGIDELLKQAIRDSQDAQRDMNRILEIAIQQGQPQSGGGGGDPSGNPSGDSPLDSQPQGPQGAKENTPETPDSKPAPKPESEGQEPGGAGRPQSPRQSVDDPRNRESAPPDSGETGSINTTDGADRWGDLPIHVRDLFRTEGGGDMPPQYRDWIDAYYRRLNQRP